MRVFRSLFAVFALISSSAFAGPILLIENERIVGIHNLQVDDEFYNATFKIGSCNELFSGCTKSGLGSLDAGINAPHHSGVIQKSGQVNWVFRTLLNNMLLLGELDEVNLDGFRVYTPFRAQDDVFITPQSQSDTYHVVGIEAQALYNGFYFGDGYVANDGVRNYAVWDKVVVPEPSTLAIFVLGLFGLVSRRLKKQA